MSTYDPRSRRLFLRGAGASLIGIPMLPSLLPREARAAIAPSLRYVQIITVDGRHERPWYGNLGAGALQRHDRHTHYQALTDVKGEMSPMLNAATWDGLRKKISVLRGLDAMNSSECHSMGNPTTCSTNGATGNPTYWLSADQAIANSKATYPDGVPQGGTRYLVLMPIRSPTQKVDPSCSFSYKSSRIGVIASSSQALAQAFPNGATPPGTGTPTQGPSPVAAKMKIVDQVKADYDAVRQSRRISAADRAALSSFMDLLNDIQSSLKGGATAPARPGTFVAPPAAMDSEEGYEARTKRLVNIAVAALASGSTKVVSLSIIELAPSVTVGGKEYHDAYAHSMYNGDAKILTTFNACQTYRAAFAAYFMKQMDAIQDVGGTLLDNSFVLFTNMISGFGDHSFRDMPVVAGGALGGKLRPGFFVDFRQRDTSGNLLPGKRHSTGGFDAVPGRAYNDLFTTVLDAMGVPKADFSNSQGGFGDYSKPYSGDYGQFYDGVDKSQVRLPFYSTR